LEAKKISFLFFICIISIYLVLTKYVVSAFAAGTPEKIPSEFLNPQTKEEKNPAYLISKKDGLLITVWANDDLKTEVIVGPDGKISFPLIGEVQAEGLTISQLDNVITEGLKKYIRQPEVSVMIKEFAGKRVSILGEINNPGIYKLDSEDRILELVAMAGGFTPDAVLNKVIIIRKRPEPVIILVTLNKAILKADPIQNIVLQPDDIIYISKKLIANIKYFWDQVFGPATDQAVKTQDLTGRW